MGTGVVHTKHQPEMGRELHQGSVEQLVDCSPHNENPKPPLDPVLEYLVMQK